MKIFTFGHDIDTHYPGAKFGNVPETWITQAQAQALVDEAMKETNIVGKHKYNSRDEAEKAVIDRLYHKNTGISVSGDQPIPIRSYDEHDMGAFFGGIVVVMGICLGINRMRKGL
jgi:hypothetical protein